MENDLSAHDALAAVETDRRRLGERMTAETPWAAPAQGLVAALLVGAPAAGFPGVFFVTSASIALAVAVEWMFRKRSGLSISAPAGRRGMALLVLLIVLLCGLTVLSYVLLIFDLTPWIAPLAVFGGVLTALGVVAYDRVYASDVRRVR